MQEMLWMELQRHLGRASLLRMHEPLCWNSQYVLLLFLLRTWAHKKPFVSTPDERKQRLCPILYPVEQLRDILFFRFLSQTRAPSVCKALVWLMCSGNSFRVFKCRCCCMYAPQITGILLEMQCLCNFWHLALREGAVALMWRKRNVLWSDNLFFS